jgi:hypothetical protein
MADALPESALAALDDPFAQLAGPLAGTTRLDFEVVDSVRLTPHMQRLRLTAPPARPGPATGSRASAAREDRHVRHGRLALFIGHESALPATFAMAEALPPDRPAALVLEMPRSVTSRTCWPRGTSASPGCTASARPLVTRRPSPPKQPRSSCRPAVATPTCSARRRSYPGCGRS